MLHRSRLSRSREIHLLFRLGPYAWESVRPTSFYYNIRRHTLNIIRAFFIVETTSTPRSPKKPTWLLSPTLAGALVALLLHARITLRFSIPMALVGTPCGCLRISSSIRPWLCAYHSYQPCVSLCISLVISESSPLPSLR